MRRLERVSCLQLLGHVVLFSQILSLGFSFVTCRLQRQPSAPRPDHRHHLALLAAAEQMPSDTEIPPLTILLPAYNEFLRIEETLERYQEYLTQQQQQDLKTDILVVDDGSTDGTKDLLAELSMSYTNKSPSSTAPISFVSLSDNRGKGAAISFGIEHILKRSAASSSNVNEARLVLIVDADGSADLACLPDMFNELKRLLTKSKGNSSSFWSKPAIVVGNRGYDGASLSRSVLRWGFRTSVRLICGDLGVSDSQCGCKLLTLNAARLLYHDLYLARWAHDVEVLFRAHEWSVPIGEVRVPWQDKEGSKLVTSAFATVQASLGMLVDVLRMRQEYAAHEQRRLPPPSADSDDERIK
jgi:dolichyl-phosphate beta-glucosyltransferase